AFVPSSSSIVTFGFAFVYSAMTSRGTTPWFAPTYTKNVSFTGPSAPAGLPPDVGPPTGDPPPHAARNDSAAVVEIPSAADRCRNCRRLIPRRYRRSSVLISSGTGPPPSPSAVAEAPVVAFAGPPAVPERASSYRDEYDAEARAYHPFRCTSPSSERARSAASPERTSSVRVT